MKNLILAKKVLTIMLIGIIILNIITYFMPMYSYKYAPSYDSEKTSITDVYLYSGYISYSPFTTMTLLIPIISITFLLIDFKHSKPISFAFATSQFMSNILLLLSISSYIDDRRSNDYTYKTLYGYNICIAMTVLLAIILVTTIAIYAIIKLKTVTQEQPQQSETKAKTDIDIFKERIGILDELKQSGALTESEYQQKRNDVVKKLNI